jgi:pantothenate kinase
MPRGSGSHVAHVPMDGFHLADVERNRLGCGGRKGAPETFDAADAVARPRSAVIPGMPLATCASMGR